MQLAGRGVPEGSAARGQALAVGLPLLSVYIGSIVAANWLTTHYGLVRVAPGLYATAGTAVIGGVIMTRDLLQDALGRIAVLSAIIIGALLSFAMSSHHIAIASGVTFLLAEAAEFAVYTPLRRKVRWGTPRWASVVGVANATGIVGDTLLFLWLAGFPLTQGVIAGQLVGKAYVTLAVAGAALLIRRLAMRPA